MRLLALVGRSVLCSSLLPLPRKQSIDKRISRRLCAPPMVLSTGKECISFVAFRHGFHSSGSFRTAGRWTSSARECHSPSFGHLSIAFAGQGEIFSPWQQTLRLLWPFSRPLTFLSSFTPFDVLYTYSLGVGLFPSLPLSLSLSLSLSQCVVLHILVLMYFCFYFFFFWSCYACFLFLLKKKITMATAWLPAASRDSDRRNLEPGPSALETVAWWPKRIGPGDI